MEQSELERQLKRLRDQTTEFIALHEARRRSARQLAYVVLSLSLILLIFNAVLYLTNDPIYRSQGLALFATDITVMLVGNALIAMTQTPVTSRRRN